MIDVKSLKSTCNLKLKSGLFAFESWTHIQATKAIVETFGLPIRYYVDCLRVFRFVQGRDCVWRKHVLQIDDVDTQWGQMMNLLGLKVIFALSPQAKGKVERPYRWMQDRIIRTCALENIAEVAEAREILQEELDSHNTQVHSATGGIPRIRFERAIAEGNTLFRPFSIPEPFTSADDVFYLREKRMVNAYRRISLFRHEIQIPHTPRREYVDIHMVPDLERSILNIRIWWNGSLVHSLALLLEGFRVHLCSEKSPVFKCS